MTVMHPTGTHIFNGSYQIVIISDNVEFLRYCGGPFEGHHNTTNIQHCPISSKFDMWVDNDVPNWLTETYCFCYVSYYYSLSFSFLSADHELVHGRSQELLDRISWNFDDIGQCWIFTAHFLYRVLAAILKILKTQNCSSNGDLSLWGQSHILRGSKGVGVTIESYGKVEMLYINVDNF
jgi:hypothetical protein